MDAITFEQFRSKATKFYETRNLQDHSRMNSIKLMKHEKDWPIIDANPISALSFYTVKDITNVDKTISYLKRRFHEIVETNPWLCGRLTKERHNGETDVFLTYSKTVTKNIDDVLIVKDDPTIFEHTNWITLSDYVSKLKPKRGRDCIDKNEKLCRLLLLRSTKTQTNKLGVMFCLNHCIGDGWTFYRLWQMLDKDEFVEQLSVERHYSVKEEVAQTSNLFHLSDTRANSSKLLLLKVGRGLKRKITGKSRPKKFMYTVNKEAVDTQKRELNREDKFVSTSDILCTRFFQNTSHGMIMAMNVRKRMAKVKISSPVSSAIL